MRARLRTEDGWGLITAIWAMMIMLSLGLALYSFTDAQVAQSANERNRESTFDYSAALLATHAYVLTEYWPYTSTTALPDCASNGTTVTATGGTATVFACPEQGQLNNAFNTKEYGGSKSWTSRVRDNGGTSKCVVTGQLKCSYFYDDATVLAQPSWDANGDGQLWVRSQAIVRGNRRTVVQRVELDKRPVQFPEAVLTAGHLTLKDSPHVKVVTNYSPINLRCALNSSGCLVLKKHKQIAPYRISFSYPQQTAIPASSLSDLRERAKAEGWYYATCPTNPPGQQVFVESGTCTGASMPYTSPTLKGTYIQVTGTLTISNKQPASENFSKGRKGNFWGLIYMANSTKLTGDVLKITKGRRLIRGVVAVDWAGGFNLGGSKDTLLQYDPFVIQGLYLYHGTALVRPSFRILEAPAS